MAFYKNDFLDQRRRQWLAAIDKVQLKVGSTWYNAELQTKEIQGTGIVLIAVCSALDNVAGTISASDHRRPRDGRGRTGRKHHQGLRAGRHDQDRPACH